MFQSGDFSSCRYVGKVKTGAVDTGNLQPVVVACIRDTRNENTMNEIYAAVYERIMIFKLEVNFEHWRAALPELRAEHFLKLLSGR